MKPQLQDRFSKCIFGEMTISTTYVSRRTQLSHATISARLRKRTAKDGRQQRLYEPLR